MISAKPIVVAVALICLGTPEALAQGADISTGEVIVSVGGADGSSQLIRNNNGLSVKINATGLTPGNAYTVWWIIREPGAPTNIAVNATGGIATGTGEGHFAAHISTGPVADHPGQILNPGDGNFDTPRTATVRLVVRDHGPVVPDLIKEQISTVSGGCQPFGDFACFDPLVLRHVP